MKNVKMDVKNDELVIKVDLSKDLGPSKSGKTRTVATTNGNIPLMTHEGIKIGLNIYKHI